MQFELEYGCAPAVSLIAWLLCQSAFATDPYFNFTTLGMLKSASLPRLVFSLMPPLLNIAR